MNPPRAYGENQTDIIARRGKEICHIEVIGYRRIGPARAKDFYEAFFRAVSRLNGGAKNCVIALSQRAEIGLPARASHHRVAWKRIAEAFPELEIWLVDTSNGGYKRHSWGDWLK